MSGMKKFKFIWTSRVYVNPIALNLEWQQFPKGSCTLSYSMPGSNVGINDSVQATSKKSSNTGLLADSGRVIVKRRNVKHNRGGALRIFDQHNGKDSSSLGIQEQKDVEWARETVQKSRAMTDK